MTTPEQQDARTGFGGLRPPDHDTEPDIPEVPVTVDPDDPERWFPY